MSVSLPLLAEDIPHFYSKPQRVAGVFAPLVLLTLYGMWSQYFGLSLLSGMVLSLILYCFWRPYVPAVLMYCFGFLWLESFMIIVYADFLGVPIEQKIPTSHAETLLYYTNVQLIAMVLAASWFFRKNLSASAFRLARWVYALNTTRVLAAYAAGMVIFPTLLAVSGHGTFNQVAQSIGTLRVVFLLMLGFIMMVKRNDPYKKIIMGIFAVEFLLGFVSFFSNFKVIAIMLLLVYLTVQPGIKLKFLLRLLPAAVLMFVIMVFWSRVKDDYRAFLNGGSNQQSVQVGKSEALGFLADKVSSFTSKEFMEGVEILIFRIQGMAYYMEVYPRVPRKIPFAKGQNTKNTLDFIFVPRFINPDKPVLDPSAKISYYTGRRFKGASEGTSIAMGFFPDFYVDYGLWMMTIPLVIIAIIVGWCSNYVINRKKYNPIFNYCVITSFAISVGMSMLSDSAFLLGNIRNFVFIYILCDYLVFPRLNKFLTS